MSIKSEHEWSVPKAEMCCTVAHIRKLLNQSQMSCGQYMSGMDCEIMKPYTFMCFLEYQFVNQKPMSRMGIENGTVKPKSNVLCGIMWNCKQGKLISYYTKLWCQKRTSCVDCETNILWGMRNYKQEKQNIYYTKSWCQKANILCWLWNNWIEYVVEFESVTEWKRFLFIEYVIKCESKCCVPKLYENLKGMSRMKTKTESEYIHGLDYETESKMLSFMEDETRKNECECLVVEPIVKSKLWCWLWLWNQIENDVLYRIR